MSAPNGSGADRRRFHREILGLRPLTELEHLEVPDDQLDVRGWIVSASDGVIIGTVRELLADPDAMRVRSLVLELGPEGALAGDGRTVYVPADQVDADPERDLIVVRGLEVRDVETLPEYRRELLDRDDEAGLLRRIGVRALLEHERHGAPVPDDKAADQDHPA